MISIYLFPKSKLLPNLRRCSRRMFLGQIQGTSFVLLRLFFSSLILRLSFSETIESPDSSISYFIEIVCDPNLLYSMTVEIIQDLVLHLPFKSVIVFTFNSFLYYIPVIQEFFFYIDFHCVHRLNQSSNEGQFNDGENSIKFSIKIVIHSITFNDFNRIGT
jgi:hypothetical protein